jgi:hypothetical protein
MRVRRSKDGVVVNAIAGTNVVFLGMDLSAARRRGCLGFAIQREDHAEEERYWLKGSKTFPQVEPDLGPGGEISTHEHPVQRFEWSDYSAKPGREYTYTVIPMYGKPTKLKEGPKVKVKIETEVEMGKPHAVFFNRGSVASQEYARRFQNKAPDSLTGEARDAAYKWLSRGPTRPCSLSSAAPMARSSGSTARSTNFSGQTPSPPSARLHEAGPMCRFSTTRSPAPAVRR